ncbi:THUMP-like domain-containing protein [Muriicola sp.]|uniref:THUMP-like domain-containing protein n=1 Tax=Muriicola sp. TaxID=2020856 RepID=UPI003C747E5E
MNKNILNTGVQVFINNNLNTDILSVLLSRPTFEGISQKELVQQLESKNKARTKLPTWYNSPGIFYPPKLHIEQTSSEITARYKSALVAGKTLADLTGGFGVDSYFFSQKISKIIHCELSAELSEIAAHNFSILGISNVETHNADGIEFLKKHTQVLDWIYLDPGRRDDSRNKVYKLEDCTPNILMYLDLLFRHSKNILLKTSPLLDITAGLTALKGVQEIHVIAVQNEVKELLWVLKNQEVPRELPIKSINITNKGNEVFNFVWEEEKQATSEFSHPLRYLYEPNAAILKTGAFKSLGVHLGIQKLQEHTHLYTSEELIEFPGRTFEILEVIPYNNKNMRAFKGVKANVTIRNFPESVSKLRKDYKILDGGEGYFFFTTDYKDDRILIRCRKA